VTAETPSPGCLTRSARETDRIGRCLRDLAPARRWTVADVGRADGRGQPGGYGTPASGPGMTVAWQLPSHVSAALLMLALARSAVTQAPVLQHLPPGVRSARRLTVAEADTLVRRPRRRRPTRHPGARGSSRLPKRFRRAACAPCPPGRIPNWADPTSADDVRWDLLHPPAPPAARRACGTRMRPFWAAGRGIRQVPGPG